MQIFNQRQTPLTELFYIKFEHGLGTWALWDLSWWFDDCYSINMQAKRKTKEKKIHIELHGISNRMINITIQNIMIWLNFRRKSQTFSHAWLNFGHKTFCERQLNVVQTMAVPLVFRPRHCTKHLQALGCC
jgi:hypothetical protein